MNKNDFKSAFDEITPDMYMETRIIAKTNARNKKVKIAKKVCAFSLAFSVLSAGVATSYQMNLYTDRPFTVLVANAGEDTEVKQEISDDAITFPNIKMTQNIEEDGNGSVETRSETSFSIAGEDIKTVKFYSKDGDFGYFDEIGLNIDTKNGDLYNVIIPVDDKDVERINSYIAGSEHAGELTDYRSELKRKFDGKDVNYSLSPETLALNDYMKTHDATKYFGKSKADPIYYQISFMKYSECGVDSEKNKEGYAFFLFDVDKIDKYFVFSPNDQSSNSITVNTYGEKKINYVEYYPDVSIELIEGKESFEDKKDEEITIVATYKDGKKAKKVIKVMFEKDGTVKMAYK